MAKQVEVEPTFFARQRNGRYPWDEWTNGKVWQVVEHDDFTVAINSFRQYLYNKAKELNLDVSIKVISEDNQPTQIYFQFSKKQTGDSRDLH